MVEFLLFAGCIIFVLGLGHLPMIQAIFWYLDERENRDVAVNMDAILFSVAPLIVLIVALEIYFLFFAARA
jgi:hypothetical protein